MPGVPRPASLRHCEGHSLHPRAILLHLQKTPLNRAPHASQRRLELQRACCTVDVWLSWAASRSLADAVDVGSDLVGKSSDVSLSEVFLQQRAYGGLEEFVRVVVVTHEVRVTGHQRQSIIRSMIDE